MESVGFKYFKLSEFASPPTRATPDAAGCDLRSAYNYIVPAHGKQLILTDLSFQFPHNCYGRIAPRSGLATKHFIDVGAGVIDYDYTGNVGVLLFNYSNDDFIVKRGDRVAQIILEVYRNDIPVDGGIDMRNTERGDNGFGSTGVQRFNKDIDRIKNHNMIITLEGNIGAGKTTFAKGLFEQFKNLGLKTVHIQEPVGAWVDFHGTNLLDLLYKDIEKWAFMFQVNALMYMTECDKRAVEYVKKGYIVIKERSAFTVRHIFNEQMKKFMTPAEIYILSNLSNSYDDPRKNVVGEDVKDITLYLRTDPETCFERKLKRNRPEEIGRKNRVDELYLKELHNIHEIAIRNSVGIVVVADGTKFDPNDPQSVRVAGTGDFVFDVLTSIGEINNDLESRDTLDDEWTPEGDRITREKSMNE